MYLQRIAPAEIRVGVLGLGMVQWRGGWEGECGGRVLAKEASGQGIEVRSTASCWEKKE